MMTWIDYAILGVIGTSMLISITRGFVRELFSIVSWVAAFFVGFQYSDSFAQNLGPWVESDTFRHIVSFMVLFSVTLLTGTTVSHVISTVLSKTGLGVTDRILGVFFGGIRGILLVCVVLMIGSFTQFTVTEPWAKSSLIPTLHPITSQLIAYMPEDLHKTIEKQVDKKSAKNGEQVITESSDENEK